MKKLEIGLAILFVYLLLIGLGPIRRVASVIVPAVLEHKVTVNSVCDGTTKVYIFSGDSGSVSTQLVLNGCGSNSNPTLVPTPSSVQK